MSRPDSIPLDANPLLDAWGIEDFGRGERNLHGLAHHLGSRIGELIPHLGRAFSESPDPDLALNTLERFFARAAARGLLDRLLADDGAELNVLVQLFGASQFLGDVLTTDPDFLETATASLRGTPTLDELTISLTVRTPASAARRRCPSRAWRLRR